MRSRVTRRLQSHAVQIWDRMPYTQKMDARIRPIRDVVRNAVRDYVAAVVAANPHLTHERLASELGWSQRRLYYCLSECGIAKPRAPRKAA